MKLIYIAGPFRGATPWDVEQNVRAAETLALDTWRAGAAALCPHTNTRFFDKSGDDKVFLDGTMEMLRRCDAVRLVLGWERSSGTRMEIMEAFKLKIPVFEEGSEFRQWLHDLRSYYPMSGLDFQSKVSNYERNKPKI